MDNVKGKKGVRPPIPKITNPSRLSSSGGASSSSAKNTKVPIEPASPTVNEMEIIVNRSKKAASYLRLLTHCRFCQGSCQEKECIETFRLMKHVALCDNQTQCLVQGCLTTKRLLQHAAECSARSKSGTDGQSNACLVCTLAASSELGLPYSSPSSSSHVSPRTSTASMSETERNSNNDDDDDDELPIKTHIPSFFRPRSVSPSPTTIDDSPSTATKRRLSESASSGNIDANAGAVHALSTALSDAIQNVTITQPVEQPAIKTPRLESTESSATVFSLSLGSNSANTSFDGSESDTRRICVNP